MQMAKARGKSASSPPRFGRLFEMPQSHGSWMHRAHGVVSGTDINRVTGLVRRFATSQRPLSAKGNPGYQGARQHRNPKQPARTHEPLPVASSPCRRTGMCAWPGCFSGSKTMKNSSDR